MKDYSESIAYMRQRKQEQTESHQTPYSDAIEAMELCQPQEPKRNGAYLYCPRCGKEYTYRTQAEFIRGERWCNACGQFMVWGREGERR